MVNKRQQCKFDFSEDDFIRTWNTHQEKTNKKIAYLAVKVISWVLALLKYFDNDELINGKAEDRRHNVDDTFSLHHQVH